MMGLQRWHSFTQAFNQRALRERIMIGITLLAFSYFTTEQVIYNNVEKTISKKEQEVTVKQGLLIALQQETATMKAEYDKDSTMANRARLVELESRLHDVEYALNKLSDEIVRPSEIAHVVENILAENRRLNVISVENLKPTGINDNAGNEGEGEAAAQEEIDNKEKTVNENAKHDVIIYKHGMRLVVDGNYHDLVKLLSGLEKLPKKVLWGEVELKSIKYPVSELSLVLYTLSLDQIWLKV